MDIYFVDLVMHTLRWWSVWVCDCVNSESQSIIWRECLLLWLQSLSDMFVIFGGEFEMLPNIKHVHSASCRHRHPADIYISQEVQLTLTTPRDACTKVVEYEHHSSVLSKPYQIRNTYILFVQKLYMVGQNLRTW